MAPDDTNKSGPYPPVDVARVDVQEIIRVVKRGIWVIALSVAFVLVVGATVIFSLTPRYTASAFIETNTRQTQIMPTAVTAVLAGLQTDPTNIGTEIEILRSRNLAQRVVEKLNLYSLPEFNKVLRAPSLGKTVASSFLPELLTKIGLERRIPAGKPGSGAETKLGTDTGTSSPEVSEFSDRPLLHFFRDGDRNHETLASIAERERASVVDTYLERLEVLPLGRSRVIGVSFWSENPQTAAKIVNTTGDLYIVAQLEAKFEAARRANVWLNDRIVSLQRDVAAAERGAEDFRNKSGLTRGTSRVVQGTTTVNATLIDEQASQLNARYIQERTLLGQARARMRQAEELLKSPRGIETAAAVLNSQAIRDLRREETLVERTLNELSNQYGPRHPTMINAQAQRVGIREKIKGEIDKIVQGLRNDVAVSQGAVRSLKTELDALRNRIASLNSAQVRLRSLEREAAASRQLLEQLLARSKETASQVDFQQPDATIITVAPVPDTPTFPNVVLSFALLFMVGTGIGVYGAFLADRIDHGYRSADEITRELGVPALGLIPAIGKLTAFGKGPQDYCLDHPTSAYAEALRSLHTNMLLADVGNRPGVVLVTSALPNEGKTSLVASLARVLSGAGRAVVVVDCDLRQPSVHKAFGMKEGPGLVECVTGKDTLEHVIQEDKSSSVHVVRAGERPQNSPDLFDTVAFQQLLKTLSRSYDMVLLDSAPVLAVSDSLFLGRLANKTVLVVRWAKTRRATAALALKKLVDARANVAGVLLSRVDVKGHAQYGYSDSGAYSGALKKYYTG